MGTKAAAFNAKIQSLADYHARLLHAAIPVPSGLDIASTLANFSQTLLGILKDIQASPLVMMYKQENDAKRVSLFPNLDYTGLLDAISLLVDVIPLVQTGLQELVQGLLNVICSLMVFLERDLIETLPYMVASMLATVPNPLHSVIIDTLCYKILPFSLGSPAHSEDENNSHMNYAAASVPAVMMLVLQYAESSAHHSHLLECLLAIKSDIITDLLSVVAHGPPSARPSAANLLFHYWPNLNPTLNDRRGFHIRFQDISCVLKAMFNRSTMGGKNDSMTQAGNCDVGEVKCPKGWKPQPCQIEDCEGEGQNDAVKICLDHADALSVCPETPPPLYVCKNCAPTRLGKKAAERMVDMLMPMSSVPGSCENKNCRATEKNAVVTCFSMECASYHANKPIRYCNQCNNIRHNTRRGADHVVHINITSIWSLEPHTQNYVLEAIVSLLNEAQPAGDRSKAKEQERLNRAFLLENEPADALSMEDRRLLSRYGVWLIVGLCAATDDMPEVLLGRLIGCLCHWFSATQYLPDDQQGAPIERLKTDFIQGWLQEICKTHFETFVSCLLPHPLDYAKVGGHWDTLASKSEHIKEGFRRLFCLVPYELVTLTVWERVMPHWMEAIHNEVPEKDLVDMKINLSKLLDPEMSPLGFDSTQMYTFIAKRFVSTDEGVQEQTLSWLQLLSSLSIVIPIYQLLEMFQDGVKALVFKNRQAEENLPKVIDNDQLLEPTVEETSEGEGREWNERGSNWGCSQPEQTDLQKTLSCFILMLDVFLKQLEVQEIEKHKGVVGPVSIPFMNLMKDMLHSPCLAPHKCQNENYCSTCDLTISFFQLTMDICAYLLPLLAIQNNRVADMIPHTPNPKSDPKMESTSETVDPQDSKSSETSADEQVREEVGSTQVVTATVETVDESMDIAANIYQEQVVSAMATASTHSDAESAHAKVNVNLASVVNENDEPIDLTKSIDTEIGQFWVTSQGKFKFRLDDLPSHLQVIYTLLELLEKAEDCDIVYHLCECLKYLILHGESFAQAAADHRGFLIWCQETKNIQLVWNLIEAEWSHVAEVCVALLLHFLQLPCGADIFWKLCENHFHHSDWKIRFQAVEKVVVIGRFLTVASVKQCPGLQAAIAHAFCFCLASLDDMHVAVAQRAHLYLTSLPDSGLRALSWCLEQQFDSVILDRPMIIQALHQLTCLLPEKKVLSWEFFYNRFDALYLEAQIALEKHGDIAFPRDLRNSDMTSDIFARKLSRAQDALNLAQNASAKTLSSSLGTKWPYKRTMSAPANMLNRMDAKDRTAYRVEADGGMKVFDDGTMVHQLQRAMDLDETDRDTFHLLVFLLMQFLSLPQHASAGEEKTGAKVMTFVLRHLSVLMGYSLQERSFAIPPNKLRTSPVFNAFLSSLPNVLDHNFSMGRQLLPTCLPLLQFCAAPHRMVDLRYPTYSLWCLQPHPRKWWLTSVLTILYKFDYSQQLVASQIIALIRIVLVTLENHFHQCKKAIDSTLCATNLGYSRDPSQGSLGGGDIEVNQGTPPESPQPLVTVNKDIEVSSCSKETREHKSQNEVIKIEDHDVAQIAVPLNNVEPEKANARIEQTYEGDYSQAVVAKAAIGNSIVVGTSVRPRAVTSVRATQIQAFDESVVKIEGVELASTENLTQHYGRPAVVGVYDTPSEVSETYSSDSNHASWSTDLESFLHFSESDLSVETGTIFPLDTETEDKIQRLFPNAPRCMLKHRSSDRFRDMLSVEGRTSGHPPRESANSTPSTDSKMYIVMKEPMAVSYAIETNVTEDPKSSQSILGKSTFSPKSPLSMMDLITVGSPVEVNGQHSISITSPESDKASPLKPLELPTPERLLQIEEGRLVPKQDASIMNKVWHAFEGWNNNKQEIEPCILQEVVTHEPVKKELKKAESHAPVVAIDMGRRSSTDDTSAASNCIANSTSTIEDKLSSKRRSSKILNKKNPGWDDLGTSFYSWSEPSEGSSRDGKDSQPLLPPTSSIKQSSLRIGDDTITYRCMECGEPHEEFSVEDLGQCILILATFVHREPGIAAPLLPRMLRTVARCAGSEIFSWQHSSSTYLPGSSKSIGRQFLRCTLHQLAPNQIFNQIFQTDVPDPHRSKLFKALVQALIDFNELSPSAPIQSLLENLNGGKGLPVEKMTNILANLSTYLECATQEGYGGFASTLVSHFDTFLRKLLLCVPSVTDITPLVRLLLSLLKLPGVSSHKNILDPLSKLLSYSIQNGPVKMEHIIEICYLCNRIFSRERDKQLLPRLVVFELVQALRFKTSIPDTNLVLLIQLLLQDCGGTLGPNTVLQELYLDTPENIPSHGTNLGECMRTHLHDALDFISDVHSITKIRASCKSTVGLNEDTVGGIVKAGIAQYLALEITRGNSRDNRTTAKYLPWLNSAPTAVQQGPKEFIECVVHIRLMSWLLLGSLNHTCLASSSTHVQCQPVPPEASCHVADHIQVILAGFPEHSKNTVQHMSSLYQTFILSQLWTLYMEQGAGSPTSDSHAPISAILTDFWAKITPAILQLVAHSKVLGEMVALHLMSLMEALQECQSSVLTKLLPLWAPILHTQHAKTPGQLVVRLRACQDATPPCTEKVSLDKSTNHSNNSSVLASLRRWLHRLQFKMGQIEMQSSTAIQFYSV